MLKLILYLLVVRSFPTYALNLQSYKFTDSFRYGILDDSLKEKFSGRYVITSSLAYVHAPFYFSNKNVTNFKNDIIDYQWALTAGASYYVNQTVSLGLDLNAIQNSVFDKDYSYLADTVLKARINLRRGKTSSFSLNPQLLLPTGQEKNFSTTHSVGGSLNLVGEKSLFGRLHLLLSGGFFSAKNNQFADVDHRQLLLTQLGVSYDVMDRLNLNFEVYRNFPTLAERFQDEGKYFVTAKHKTHKNFSTYGGLGVVDLSNTGRNTNSFFVGIKIHESDAPLVIEEVSTIKAAPTRKNYTDELALGPPVKIHNIYFANNSYSLDASEGQKLDDVVRYYQQNKKVIHTIVLEGHASQKGPASYNLELSKKRTTTAKNYLENKGMPNNVFTIVGHGESAKQDPIEGKNRKVQFRIHQ